MLGKRRSCATWWHAALLAAALLTACVDQPTGPFAGAPVRIERSWVTDNVYAEVDASSGLLRLQIPVGDFVSFAAANTLSVAEARFLSGPTLVGNLPSSLQHQRGSAIDFGHLTPCARATYSVSPFGDFPPTVPGWAKRSLGSHWAVPMCGADGTAQLSVGIPDQPRDVQVVDGQLVFRQYGGGADLDVVGVPPRFPSGLPLTPEEAIAVTYRFIGVRIRSLPTSYNQYQDGVGSYALCASWLISLEQPVSVQDDATGARSQVTQLFVRRTPSCYADSIAFYMPSANQPPTAWVHYPKDTTGLGTSSELDSALVPLRGPTVFEQVRP